MRAKLSIWILVMFVLVARAIATPQIGGGLVIESPKLSYYLSGDYAMVANVHVFNSSGLVSNATTICTMDIFNQSDSRIFLSNATYNGHEFLWTIPSTIVNVPSEYALTITCANPTEVGYLSTTIEFRQESPITRDIGGSPLSVLILLPIIFGLMVIAGSFLLDDDHKVMKIAMFLFAYVMVFLSFGFGIQVIVRYYDFPIMQGSIGTAIWVIGVALFVILSYFLIYAFIMSIQIAAQRKKEKLGW